MYYFYINFPTFGVDPIKIHLAKCGFCQNGNGMHGIGSNHRGFWAGPFNSYQDIVIALEQLNERFINPPGFDDAGCCNPSEGN
jgi:hypothetical protein